MVGLVIVSHSRVLAGALVDLMKQVSPGEIPYAFAAGAGEDRQAFGTDAVEIMQAVESVYSPDGVIVIPDLGSAILSAEMALELLPPEMAENVRICPAPLVEGTLAAAVQIGLGSDLDTVCREAVQALMPKVEHLSEPVDAGAQPAAEELPAAEQVADHKIIVTLMNQHGLHARPAARFVQTAGRFKANIQVTNLTNGRGPVSATGLNAIATLGAVRGHRLEISAGGEEASQALDALRKLVESNFGETAEPGPVAPVTEPAAAADKAADAAADAVAAAAPSAAPELAETLHRRPEDAPGPDRTWQAVPVSEGVALGPIYHYRPALPPIPTHKAENVQYEKQRFDDAVDQTRRAIERRYQQMKTRLGEEEAAIFEAHLLILQDPDLLDRTARRIAEQRENAAAAWSAVINEVAGAYRSLEDPYQQQRAVDVLDIGQQVLFALAGESAPAPVDFEEPVILFAQDLTPTETAQLDLSLVLGILTTGGGPTSHSAILARSAGIPAISGVSPALSRLAPGTLVAMDGFTGKIQVDPPLEAQKEVRSRRQEWLENRRRLIETSRQAAATKDGRRVQVQANVGSLKDAQAAVANGAEGIGLLRTEFTFLTHRTPPDEEEQMNALREMIELMWDRPVIVRTLDVGGDKNLPYIYLPDEANPFLGVRAIRLSFHHPDLFMTQLRAILRAGTGTRLRIMFPMIASIEEFRQARQWVESAHEALLAENLPHAWPVELGIMVEIPSAALMSRAFAPEIDFFSIGTNDLTQYTLAAERGNPMLSRLADGLHPAVLRLIKEVAEAAHEAGKWAGVCGELASDPQATAVLVGLGIDELSMNPGSIPLIKSILRKLDSGQAADLAGRVLAQSCSEDARSLAKEFLDQLDG